MRKLLNALVGFSGISVTSWLPHRRSLSILHQPLNRDMPMLTLADISGWPWALVYNIGVADTAEKLPAFGSMPLPSLEGSFCPPCGKGTPPGPTDRLLPLGPVGLFAAAPMAAIAGRCLWHSRRNSTSISVRLATSC